jgi:hypothetical protein
LRGYGVALNTNLSVDAALYYMEYIGEVKCEAYHSLSWLGTCTSIKSDGFNLALAGKQWVPSTN